MVRYEIGGKRPVVNLDVAALPDRGTHGAHDLGAGGVPVGVQDAAAAVTRFAAEHEPSRGVAIEASTQTDQFRHAGGPFPGENLDGRNLVEAASHPEGVGGVCLR